MMKLNLVQLGNRIKKLRIEKKLSQTKLAYRIGKTESSVRKYESGLTEPPLSVLYAIAEILDASIFDLLEVQDD